MRTSVRRRIVATLLVIGVIAVPLVGCDSDQSSGDRFCNDARQVMNARDFPSDGAGVVDDLRSIDVSGLSGSDGSAFAAALDVVESQITKFNDGQGQNGWSTQAAATIASRICGSDLASFNVMP